MGDALDKLVALAGTQRVSGYTRTSSTGKTVRVSSYTRSPADMSDAELDAALKGWWGKGEAAAPEDMSYNQKSNVYKQIVSEHRSRGLTKVTTGGKGIGNDPNHPSWEAKPYIPAKKKPGGNSDSEKSTPAIDKVKAAAEPKKFKNPTWAQTQDLKFGKKDADGNTDVVKGGKSIGKLRNYSGQGWVADLPDGKSVDATEEFPKMRKFYKSRDEAAKALIERQNLDPVFSYEGKGTEKPKPTPISNPTLSKFLNERTDNQKKKGVNAADYAYHSRTTTKKAMEQMMRMVETGQLIRKGNRFYTP